MIEEKCFKQLHSVKKKATNLVHANKDLIS